jgi:hypothetical protein
MQPRVRDDRLVWFLIAREPKALGFIVLTIALANLVSRNLLV